MVTINKKKNGKHKRSSNSFDREPKIEEQTRTITIRSVPKGGKVIVTGVKNIILPFAIASNLSKEDAEKLVELFEESMKECVIAAISNKTLDFGTVLLAKLKPCMITQDDGQYHAYKDGLKDPDVERFLRCVTNLIYLIDMMIKNMVNQHTTNQSATVNLAEWDSDYKSFVGGKKKVA